MLDWLSCYLPKQLTINPQRCLPDLESFSFKAILEKAKPVDISIISVIKRFVWKAHNTYFKVFRPPTPSVGHKSINLITSHTQLTYPHSYFTLHATDRTNTVHNHPFIHWIDHITTSCPKTVAHNICIFELFWLFHIHMPTEFTSIQEKKIAILYAILLHITYTPTFQLFNTDPLLTLIISNPTLISTLLIPNLCHQHQSQVTSPPSSTRTNSHG